MRNPDWEKEDASFLRAPRPACPWRNRPPQISRHSKGGLVRVSVSVINSMVENQPGKEGVHLSYHLKPTTKGIQGRDSRQELEPETTAAHYLLTCFIFSWVSSYSVHAYSSRCELDSPLYVIGQDNTTDTGPQTNLMESVLQLENPLHRWL